MYNKNTEIGFDIQWDRLPDDDNVKQIVTLLYNDVFKGAPLHNYVVINGLPIKFDPTQKVIGLNFSGGADSTMLFFILCKIIETLNADVKIVASTLVRFWEDRSWTDDLTTNIFKYMQDRFPKIQMIHEFGFVPPALEITPLKNLVFEPGKILPFEPKIMETAHADVYVVRNFSDYLARKYNITVTYSGTTMNPEHLNEEVKAPKFRELREITAEDIKSYTGQPTIHDPLILVQKTWVMAQYKNFGLEDLLQMTRSCAAGRRMLDEIYGAGQWQVNGSDYSCGECFFCLERQWASENTGIYLEEYHK